jgi:leader peptidase (prepilin peptidase)/N-methyltransferase
MLSAAAASVLGLAAALGALLGHFVGRLDGDLRGRQAAAGGDEAVAASSPVSPARLLMDLAAAVVAATVTALLVVGGLPPLPAVAVAVAAVAVLGLALIDLRYLLLPDLLVLIVALLGLALSLDGRTPAATPLGAGLGALVAGGLTGGLRWGYEKLRHREGLGLGDVKFSAAAGLWLGPDLIGLFLLVAAVATLAAAVVLAWRGGKGRLDGAQVVPLGPGLCLAAALPVALHFALPIF